MLLTADGHLDIERVKQLNEAELEKEMEDWGDDELLAWERSKGTVSLEEFYAIYRQKIRELWSK